MTELISIRRADVRLDSDKLQGFVTTCIAQGECMSDIFLNTCICLERDERITLEFLPDCETLHYATFSNDEWSAAANVSEGPLRLLGRSCRKPDCGVVFGIFTGNQLNEEQLQTRRRQSGGIKHPIRNWRDERFA